MSEADRKKLFEAYISSRSDQLALCNALEAIADSLPSRVDRQSCLHLARAIRPVLERAHRLEEEEIYPALSKRRQVTIDLETTVERLSEHHAVDAYFSEELAEMLMALGRGESVGSAEAAGYMFRGFFEGLRRHIAFEGQIVAGLRADEDDDETKTDPPDR